MSINIPTHFVKDFTTGITHLQQQRGSRLRGAVSVSMVDSADRAFFDQLDSIEAEDITNRHAETEYSDPDHERRMVTMQLKGVAALVDRADVRRVLNSPVNAYTESFAMAIGRKIDDTILNAFDATASTGVDGSGTASFDTNFSFSEASSTNFAHADLITARRLLEAAENMEDDDAHRWYTACSANQRENLLSDSVIQSIDTNTVRALVNGQIDQYMGFTFLKTQRAPIDGSNIRDVYFWVKASMKLAINEDARGFIDVLPHRNHSTQVRYEVDIGATRMDESGVVRCLADES